MTIETILRDALEDVAGDAVPVPGLADAALRQARRRRTAVRGAMAAVAVIALPAAVVASVPNDLGTTQVAEGEAEILPAPEWRELTGAELTAAFAECAGGQLASGDGSEPWTPARGLELVDPVPDTAASTWVVTRSGGQVRVECALTEQDDVIVGLASRARDYSEPVIGTLALDVDAGVGLYANPVTRVTVREADGPEQDAILWDGYWFYPLTRTSPADRSCVVGPGGTGSLAALDLPLGVTVRGYDAGGEPIWTASGTDRPGCPPAD